MKALCMFLALASLMLFTAAVAALFQEAWAAAAMYYTAGSAASYALMYMDKRHQPRGRRVVVPLS